MLIVDVFYEIFCFDKNDKGCLDFHNFIIDDQIFIRNH